jgi:hypothetical protein
VKGGKRAQATRSTIRAEPVDGREIEMAEAIRQHVKPLDVWLKERPRTDAERRLYDRVVDELKAMAAGLRPRELVVSFPRKRPRTE